METRAESSNKEINRTGFRFSFHKDDSDLARGGEQRDGGGGGTLPFLPPLSHRLQDIWCLSSPIQSQFLLLFNGLIQSLPSVGSCGVLGASLGFGVLPESRCVSGFAKLHLTDDIWDPSPALELVSF